MPTVHTQLVHKRLIASGLLRVLCLVLLLVTGTRASGQEVLVVVSSDSKPYIQAADSCEATLSKAGRSFRRVMLDELDAAGLPSHQGAVVAIGGPAASELEKALPSETPLFYCMSPSPDKIGLTARDQSSGISTEPDLASQIKLIDESGIRVARVGMIYNSQNSASVSLMNRFRDALPSAWELVAIDLQACGSGSGAIGDLMDAKPDLIWTAADTSVYNSTLIKALLLESLKKRVPVFGFSHGLVRAGAVFGVGFDPSEQGERAAEMLLAGDEGVHEPAQSDLAINNTVAERIKVHFDRSFIDRAKRLFGQ